MIERARRAAWLPPLVLAVALAIGWLLPAVGWLSVPTADDEAAGRMVAALDALPDDATVLVGFDADLGTYAEIRPTVRALIADLLARGGRLAFVSVTSEGRALASAELGRLARGDANPTRLLDLGFVSGAEAALVDLAREVDVPDAHDGAFARQVAADGFGAFDAIAVVGGNDIGPRTWVEQVVPRVDVLSLIAVTPTVLLPETQPFVGRQVTALLGTPRDGAAYRADLELGNLERLADGTGPRAIPILLGMLVAIGVIAQALARRVTDRVGTDGGRAT